MERHAKQLHVRMSDHELARAKALAGELGMTLSDLVRILVQMPASWADSAAGSRQLVVVDRTAAMRIDSEARRWGHHYNQAAHALNRIAYYLARDEADAGDALEELGRVSMELDALMAEVGPVREQMGGLAERRLAFL